MAENNIMALVGAFIGIAIMLGIGIQILGNSVQDCSTLPDYNATTPSANQTRQGITLDNQQTGWAGQCVTNNDQTQNAYTLLVIILIVVAAIAILSVVKML